MADTGTNKSNIIDMSKGGVVSKTGLSPYKDDIGTSSFTFGGKPPIEYIQFLLGDELFSLFGDLMLNEAFESAFKTVSEIVSDSVILENLGNSNAYLNTTDSVYGAQGFSYEKRILKVLRQNTTDEDSDGSEQYYYVGRRVTQHLDNSYNPYSIYYENDPFDPTYFIDVDGGVKIRPKNSSAEPTGKVYYMSFPKFGVGNQTDSTITHDLGESSGWSNFSLINGDSEGEIFHGLPVQAREGVYLIMAINLCFGFLSNHVQDDEDTELVSLLNTHLDFLTKKSEVEIKRISEQYGVAK
jgi:hypothetical protein